MIKNINRSVLRQFFLIFFGITAFAIMSFSSFEPSMGYAATSTGTSTVQLTVQSSLSINGGCSGSYAYVATMTPNIAVGQDSSIGSTTCGVNTNSLTGYVMKISATGTPAMKGTASSTLVIPDFGTTSAAVWGTPSTAAFGYTAYNSNNNVDAKFTASGITNCGTAGAGGYTAAGSNKFLGLTTTGTTTASESTPTGGYDTIVLCWIVAQNGASYNISPDTYKAIIVATVTAN